MTTSAPPPRDPDLAADPDYRQAAAEDWYGRVADYYADQQAEVDEEARCLATQADRDAELDARQMDAQHQDALAEDAARTAEATRRAEVAREIDAGRVPAGVHARYPDGRVIHGTAELDASWRPQSPEPETEAPEAGR